MIKLILHFTSGTRTELVFTELTEYTNYLITNRNQVSQPGFLHFEVFEYDECVGHAWKYIPLCDRTNIAVNFECDDCDSFLEVTTAILDELYRKAQGR